jgi:hypothetical protein
MFTVTMNDAQASGSIKDRLEECPAEATCPRCGGPLVHVSEGVLLLCGHYSWYCPSCEPF